MSKKSVESKAKWLSHGISEFSKSGFQSFKLDQLSKKVGLARTSFYHHFADEDAFFVEVIKHWQTSHFSVIYKLLPLKPEDVIAALPDLIAPSVNTRFFVHLCLEAGNSDEIKTILVNVKEAHINTGSTYLMTHGFPRESFKDIYAYLIGLICYGMTDDEFAVGSREAIRRLLYSKENPPNKRVP